MALNCDKRDLIGENKKGNEKFFPQRVPCKNCRNCRSIIAGNHPDVIVIDNKNKPIKIERVRSLIAALSMKVYGTGSKVAIVKAAHMLTLQAANALLKVLEEPPGNTIIILTAPHANDLLPTIVSRCQQIRFGSVNIETLANWLVGKVSGLDMEQARVLAAMADGRPAKALELANGGIAQRDRLLSMSGLDGKLTANKMDLISVLAWAAHMSASPETIDNRLSILETWLRDLVVASINPDLLINKDRSEDLIAMASKTDPEQLLDCFDAVCSARRQLEANANRRLALEVMAMRLTKLLQHGFNQP